MRRPARAGAGRAAATVGVVVACAGARRAAATIGVVLACAGARRAAAAIGFVLVCAGAAGARADTVVDWARGRITATGIGVADRRAPSPATARGPARRAAEDAARKRLAAALPGLPLAEGGTLAARLADADLKARIDRAVAAALVVEAEPETDGSWRVTMAVPLEAVRIALTTPRPLDPGGDRGPPVVIVEGATTARPAIGWTIGGVAAPTLWVAEVPRWAAGAPRMKATGARHGAIMTADRQGTGATLFLVVIGP